MKLIRQKYNYHVSLDTVDEFEKTLLSDELITSVNEKNKTFSKILIRLWNVFLKFKFRQKNSSNSALNSSSYLLAILMGTDFSKCFPYFISSANKSIYLFDAWPNKHEKIIKFIDNFNVNNLFLTSSQATEIIQSKVKKTNCFWIPEGIQPEKYKHYNFKEKSIDVLALGRKYNVYHKQIVTFLKDKNKVYLYEKEPGKIIFPTQKGFIEGMAKAKISICIPSNITHPERAGEIETMTVRYLQSMVSKCIILGNAPKEMITLFGYNPVIEIDKENPEEQILSILNNYSNYFPLVEKNYQNVIKNHTWENRWIEMKEKLKLVN